MSTFAEYFPEFVTQVISDLECFNPAFISPLDFDIPLPDLGYWEPEPEYHVDDDSYCDSDLTSSATQTPEDPFELFSLDAQLNDSFSDSQYNMGTENSISEPPLCYSSDSNPDDTPLSPPNEQRYLNFPPTNMAFASQRQQRSGKRNAPSLRNRQVHIPQITTEELLRYNYRCPVPACTYKPKSKLRMHDFRRHLESHQSKRALHCAGVPESEAHDLMIDSEYAVPYMVEGRNELHVGGCMQLFSRADSLRRHLANGNTKCVSVGKKKK